MKYISIYLLPLYIVQEVGSSTDRSSDGSARLILLQ